MAQADSSTSNAAAPLVDQVRTLVRSLFATAGQPILDGSLVRALGDCVPADTLAAPWAEERVRDVFSPERPDLLDFGCGGSHHRAFIEGFGYRWQGVDYMGGVATGVAAAVEAQPDIVFYDGLTLPFPDASFDVVFSMLSLHCVQDIGRSFSEIARVLRPGGRFIGQTASLEAMQDFTTYTFTPHGFRIAVDGAGLRLFRVWPKHDALSFLLRRLLIEFQSSEAGSLDGLLNPSGLVYECIVEAGTKAGLSIRDVNLLRVLFSAHFVFEAEKP
ncbi:class I SAM-dependent methyltransferase [Methylobacterium sp. EM32]|uniref:class I SAM-dependent methyltransferase n=1 Tax=Methylobacterium sp. EM32 TaxID=3163481 RepID=UPI0033B82BE3